ncbi:unnamed protein product, partial [marine sediment metagenome]
MSLDLVKGKTLGEYIRKIQAEAATDFVYIEQS